MAKLINLNAFRNFFASSSAGGILLLVSVMISLTVANTNIADDFQSLLNTQLGFQNTSIHLRYLPYW